MGMLLSSVALLAAGAMLVGGGLLFRRRILQWMYGGDAGGEPFTLQDLRELHDSGQISRAEFEAMRGALLGKYADKEGGMTPEGDERP